MSDLPFKPLGDRVVIKADMDDHAPEQTESGVLMAKTLAAAVDGFDVEESWFVGTVVGVGPLVNYFEIRPYLARKCREMGRAVITEDELRQLPPECPDVLKVGDRVTFSWASGQQLNIDGDKFLIMSREDVLAVLEADKLETM